GCATAWAAGVTRRTRLAAAKIARRVAALTRPVTGAIAADASGADAREAVSRAATGIAQTGGGHALSAGATMAGYAIGDGGAARQTGASDAGEGGAVGLRRGRTGGRAS